jgi:hypothetical protein
MDGYESALRSLRRDTQQVQAQIEETQKSGGLTAALPPGLRSLVTGLIDDLSELEALLGTDDNRRSGARSPFHGGTLGEMPPGHYDDTGRQRSARQSRNGLEGRDAVEAALPYVRHGATFAWADTLGARGAQRPDGDSGTGEVAEVKAVDIYPSARKMRLEAERLESERQRLEAERRERQAAGQPA